MKKYGNNERRHKLKSTIKKIKNKIKRIIHIN